MFLLKLRWRFFMRLRKTLVEANVAKKLKIRILWIKDYTPFAQIQQSSQITRFSKKLRIKPVFVTGKFGIGKSKRYQKLITERFEFEVVSTIQPEDQPSSQSRAWPSHKSIMTCSKSQSFNDPLHNRGKGVAFRNWRR